MKSIRAGILIFSVIFSSVATAQEWSWDLVKTSVQTTVQTWLTETVYPALGYDKKKERAVASEKPAPQVPQPRGSESTASQPIPPPVVTPIPKPPEPAVIPMLPAVIAKPKSQKVVEIKKPGRAADTKNLTVKVVPRYIMPKNIQQIPALDIGLEPELSAQDFALELNQKPLPQLAKPVQLQTIPPLSQKELSAITKKPMLPFSNTHFENLLAKSEKLVSVDTIKRNFPHLGEDVQVSVKPFEPLSDQDLKFLASRILIEQDKCIVAMGLLNDLETAKGLEVQAKFYGGNCASQFKLNTESFRKLSDVVKSENSEFASQALSILLNNLPLADQNRMAELLIGHKKIISEKDRDQAGYLMAKYLFRKHQYEQSLALSEKVTQKSAFYSSAQVLKALAENALDKLPKAAKTLEEILAYIEKNNVEDKNLEAVANMTLARIRFQQKQFKEAQSLYQKVGKDHPYWIAALVEQGWTQIYLGDASGAIGNMYSLHSPFFSTVYKPESYVVRTIGYLNICQYGDAYRNLSVLEKDYRPWRSQIEGYINRNLSAEQSYATIKTYMRGKPTDPAEGMAASVLREVARRKDFLNQQSILNDKEDELARYATLDDKVNFEKARLKTKMDELRTHVSVLDINIEKAKTNQALKPNVEKWKSEMRSEQDLLVGLKFVQQVYEDGRAGVMRVKTAGTQHIDQEKLAVKNEAGKMVTQHLKAMDQSLSKMLDNNEFLRYEVFSGSGENIRYQVAGGATNGRRVPASSKPEKNLNWEFDGEYWQDEIGHYRSGLQDNCPNAVHKGG